MDENRLGHERILCPASSLLVHHVLPLNHLKSPLVPQPSNFYLYLQYHKCCDICALDFHLPEETAEELAADLAVLGYEGFAHLWSRGRQKNRAVVLVTALAQSELEARLFEAPPWLMVRYPDMPFDWLVRQAKLSDLQNRLGFVTTLAREVVERQTPNDKDCVKALRKLDFTLEASKLATVEPLRKASVGPRERQWLMENRSGKPAAGIC